MCKARVDLDVGQLRTDFLTVYTDDLGDHDEAFFQWLISQTDKVTALARIELWADEWGTAIELSRLETK